MTVDLTLATSLVTVTRYGLAPSRGILNSTAHMPPGLRRIRTVASPLGERNLVNDHTHDHGYHRGLDGTCSYCADTHPAEPDIPMQVFDRATGSWIVESILSEAA